jgi:phage terminase large subunit GpA-like protein
MTTMKSNRQTIPKDQQLKVMGRPVGKGRRWGVNKLSNDANPFRQNGKFRHANPLVKGFMEGFRPQDRLTLSEYAEQKIILSPERSASPGPFRVGDAIYQYGMMDAITDPDVYEVIFLTSSQVGKSSILTAAQAYYAETEPSPQLAAFPTQIIADAFLSEQFEPMVRDAPTLRPIFDNLDYPGGYIAFVGANNPSQLAMRPIRVTTGDEVDRWPLSSGKEGNPADLLRARAKTFRNRKHIFASTPLQTKTSQILGMFKGSKQHFFHVVCAECKEVQPLKWKNVIFSKDNEKNAHYACEGCGELWTEKTKRRLIRDAVEMGGGWMHPETIEFYDGYFRVLKPTSKPIEGVIGFWVNELYSPWSSMAEMAKAWSDAQGNPLKQQTFRNTREGMPWDGDVSSAADADMLMQRRETYSPKIVPAKAGMVTAAVDVQDDRLEVLTQAWGVEDESWVLEHHVINLDPSLPATWDRLKEFLLRSYPHEKTGKRLFLEGVAIDSGGHATQMVYKFCAMQQKVGRNWYAIRGVPGEGKLPWRMSQQKLRDKTLLFLVGVDDAKSTIYARYAVTKVGPGYVHLHQSITNDMVAQMTSEFAITEVNKHGFPSKAWDKPIGRRNEMLDLMVYNYAVRSSINIDMKIRLARLNMAEGQVIDAAAIGSLFK